MTSLDLKIGTKYKVKGLNNPVRLIRIKPLSDTAIVEIDGNASEIEISDFIAPVIDSLLVLLAQWLKSLFTKKSK